MSSKRPLRKQQGLTVSWRDVCSVKGTVEKLYDFALDTLCLHLDSTEKLVPYLEGVRLHSFKVEVRYFRFSI